MIGYYLYKKWLHITVKTETMFKEDHFSARLSMKGENLRHMKRVFWGADEWWWDTETEKSQMKYPYN